MRGNESLSLAGAVVVAVEGEDRRWAYRTACHSVKNSPDARKAAGIVTSSASAAKMSPRRPNSGAPCTRPAARTTLPRIYTVSAMQPSMSGVA